MKVLAAMMSFLLLALGLASKSFADDVGRGSLAGLHGVYVSAQVQDERGLFGRWADTSSVKTSVELRLREAGVHVMGYNEMLSDIRQPSLDVYIWAMPTTPDALAFAIYLRFTVNQRLKVPGALPLASTTWGNTWASEHLLLYGTDTLNREGLRQVTGMMCDEFLNDWLASHGK